MIPLKPITGSTQIQAHGYDPVSQTLAVQFNNGGVYQYAGVPPDLAEKFAQAGSVGKFLHAHIRGRFPHERMPADEPSEVTTTDGKTVDFAEPWKLP